MNREIEFAKTLERVRKMAADQGGMISKEQVQQAFAELELSEEQLALVFDYLKKHKVGIGEPVNLDDYLTEEEHDYLKEYLEALSGIEQVSDGQREAYILSAMAGDRDAQNSLIQIFLPQVAEIAKLYTGQGVYLEDLIGQGNMAVSEGVTMLGCQENAADAEAMLVKMIMDSMEEMIQCDMEALQSDQKLADKVDKSAPFLDFKHVSLTYQGAGAPTLQDMNFTVNRGDTVGIIGGTGSGKTSLVNLIPGFYPATEGEILLEGRDIRTMSDEELRGRIGVVPQKAVLFKGTIRSNLQWGKPDATEEEMWKALELAQASEVVDGKPGKLDATVAQNGKNFSGGQRQRLTIARALVRNPEILILDDSASALDYATDAKLRAAIRTLEDKTTTFIVSQRASTIRHADKIIVLDDGEIAGMGTHDELLKDCTVYQEIYYSQYPEQRGGVR